MAQHLIRLAWSTLAQGVESGSQIRPAAAAMAGGSIMTAAAGAFAMIALGAISAPFQPMWLIATSTMLAIVGFSIGLAGHAADALDNRTLAVASGAPSGLSGSTLWASYFTMPALLALVPYVSFAVLAWTSGHHWIASACAAIGWLQWVMIQRFGVRMGRMLSEQHLAREGRAAIIYALLLLVSVLVIGLWLFPWQDAVLQHGGAVYEAAVMVPVVNLFLGGYEIAPLVVLGTNGALLVVMWTADLLMGARAGRRALFHPQYGGRTRLGAFRGALGSATRNIAARTWISWLRDPRYQVLLGTVIVLPPLLLLPVWIGGAPAEVLRLVALPLFMMCFGWALHNDVAYDFTALWVHVTGGLSGRADRAGRAIPTLVTGGILSIIGAVMLGLSLSDPLTAIAVLSVSVAVLGTTVGGSSIMSTLAPYPVARPGDSPFSQPVRSWGSAVATQPLALVCEVALCLPTVFIAWDAVSRHDWATVGISAGIGVGTAVVAVAVGIIVGGRIFESRRTALLTFAQSY